MVLIYLITLLISLSPEEWSISAWGEPPVKLEARIVNPKSVYYHPEPIWLEWQFYNVSKERVKVWLPYNGMFGKNILRIEGKKEGERFIPQFRISTTWGVLDWEKEGGEILQPGDTLHQIIDLSYEFIDFSQEGSFHLSNLVYTNLGGCLWIEPRPLRKPFWWGTIEAPLNFVFEVKPPEGEDRKALNLLKAKTLDDKLQILHQHPTSSYVYLIFEDRIFGEVSEVLREKRYQEYSKWLKEVDWYIQNFKDSPRHKFPPQYWEKWIKNRDKLIIGIEEYKEKEKK